MAPDATGQTPLDEKKTFAFDDHEKVDIKQGDVESVNLDLDSQEFNVLDNERDLITHVISVADDPSLNPWTLRAFIIGIGLSAFGGVLGTQQRSP